MNKNTRHILSLLLLLWAALMPATAKASFVIPYINDFEGQNSLSGWNLEDGQCFVHTDANHTPGGSRCLEIGCSDCTYHYIVLPEFTAYTNTLRMTFWLRPADYADNGQGTFAVGYLTGNGFTALETYSYNEWNDNTFVQKTVDFDVAGVTNSARIAIKQYCSAGRYWYVDDITVRAIPSCDYPTDPEVCQVTLNSAMMRWTPGKTGDVWQICLNNDEDNLIEAHATPFTITGLTPCTAYTAKVRTYCSVSEQSEWTDIVAFSTAQLTVHEGTEENSYVPFYGAGANNVQRNQMIYPAAELDMMVDMELTDMTFYYSFKGDAGSGIGDWTVSLGETQATTLNGLDNTTPLTQVFSGNLDALFNPSDRTLTLHFASSYLYHGGNLLVEFSHSGSTSKAYMFYGETVTGASYSYDAQRDFLPKTTFTFGNPPSCIRPTGLVSTLCAGAELSVTLSWTERGSATDWVLQYGTDANFIGATTVNVNNHPNKDLTGLTEGVTYYARVKSVCGAGSESQWSEVYAFRPKSITVHEGTATNQYVPFYGEFADDDQRNQMIYPATELAEMNSAEITQMTFYYSLAGDGNSVGDWTVSLGETQATTLDDLDVTTPMMQVFSGNLDALFNTTNQTLTLAFDDYYPYHGGNLLVEFSHTKASYKEYAFYGETVLGASYSYGTQRNFLPKTTFAYDTPPSCPRPTGLTGTLSQGQGIQVTYSWTEQGAATQWVLQYGTYANFDGYTQVVVSDTPCYTVSELDTVEIYYTRVKSVCCEGDTSAWSKVCTIAPNTLTVCTGYVDSEFIPVNGTNSDGEGTYSECIFPDSLLMDMRGKEITSLSFYLKESADLWSSIFKVYMKEVDNQRAFDLTGPELCSVVYTGTLDGTGSKMDIHLDEGFSYSDKNLLIGICVSTPGNNWSSAEFYGINPGFNASVYSYVSNDTSVITTNFLPKTTFTYKNISCPKPVDFSVAYVAGDNTKVTLSWTEAGSAEEWIVQYSTTTNFAGCTSVRVTGNPSLSLTSLTPGATYYARVKAVCGLDEESAWSTVLPFTLTDLQTLTVCKGYDENGAIPVNGDRVDISGNISEFVIPTDQLTQMRGKEITALRFYLKTPAEEPWNDATFKVYMKEVDYLVLDEDHIAGPDNSTVVYTGVLDGSNATMDILFDNDFTFSGNQAGLLIGTYVASAADDDYSAKFFGLDTPYDASIFKSGNYNDSQDFLPKTTFTYLSASTPTCPRPKQLKATNTPGDDTKERLQWTQTGVPTSWAVEYGTTADFAGATTVPVTGNPSVLLTNLSPEVTYYARVKAVKGNTTSAWSKPVSFVTSSLVIIGSGQEGDEDLPTDNYSKYSLTQQIYTAQEIGISGAILSIDFYKINDKDCVRNMDIYMVHTSKTAFADNNDWIHVTDNDLVFRGYVDFAYGDWTTIFLDTPFFYNGTDNLAIIIDDNTGSYEGDTRFLAFPCSNNQNQALATADDDTNYNPYTISSDGTLKSVKNQIRLLVEDTYSQFTIAGLWNDSDNWTGPIPTAERVAIILQGATIPSGYRAEAKTVVLAGSSASLTVEDGGQLVTTNAVEATMKKNITPYNPTANPADGWHFIASPLVGSLAPTAVENLVATPATDYDLYRFDPTATMEWQNYKNPAHTDGFRLESGQGYLYANANGCTLKFTGNTQPYEASTNSVALADGWNLIGNPYPHNVYASQSYYTLNEAKNNLSAEIGSATAIPPCTGIMVQKEDALAVVFSKTAPLASPQGSITVAVVENAETVGSRSQTPAHKGDGPGAMVLDKAVVSFNEGNQLGKFYFGEQDANISIPQDGKEYAILSVCNEARQVSTEMPLNFKASKNGTYTLTVNPENVDLAYLHLIDNLTGADIDLLAHSAPEPVEGPNASWTSYTFTAKTTDDASRFRLVFNPEPAEGQDASPFAFYSDGDWIIMNEGAATLQVIDLLGRQLSSEEIHSSYRIPSSAFSTPGVYVLQLIHSDKVRTQKIVTR